MPFSAADLSTLSRLLDEALDLPVAEFEAWLQALPAEHAHLKPQLRLMLAGRNSTSSAGFLSDGPKLAEPADESVAHANDLVGPYRLLREIGHGGMGAVWLAERADGSLKRQIALKLPRLTWGGGLAERMARERDIGALLEHPNIARLYDAGVDARGRPYLALEYIDGQPLDAWCEAQALTTPQRIRLFLQVARAVAYAHGRLVVHRDLKPSNVLVTADGQAHLLDFGIAKLLDEAGSENLTQEQGRVLTPHYASPEQIKGETITVASDVYSLGALLYELLTGQHPYSPERKSLGALEQEMLEGEPPLASSRARDATTARQLRGEIDAILAKALRREPNQRYATADAMAQDLERHLQGERVLARPDTMVYRLRKVLRRYRVAFATTGAVLLAVLGGAAVSIVQAKRANDAAERARVVKEFVVDVFKVNERGLPGNQELQKLPAEMLLQRGAELIKTKFEGQPQLQSELYGVVGGIFLDMGASDQAVIYATHQIDAEVALGADANDRARSSLLLAEALLGREQWNDAEARANEAIGLASPGSDLRNRAVAVMARALIAQAKLEQATALLDRAEGELNERSKETAANARLKWMRGAVLRRQDRIEQAVSLYKSAIELALRTEGPQSPVAMEARLGLATVFVGSNRYAQSREYFDAAMSTLRSRGPAGEARAAYEESTDAISAFIRSEPPQIDFDTARKPLEHSQAELKRLGPWASDSYRAWVDFNLASAYLDWGDVEHSLPLLLRSASALHEMGQARTPRWLFLLADEQAWVNMLAGRHDEAEAFYVEQHRQRLLTKSENSPHAAFDWADRAANLRMARRFAEARLLLASAPIFGPADGEPNPTRYVGVIPRALAAVELEEGHAAKALALLPPEDTDSDDRLFNNDSELRGEVLCALNRNLEGLAQMEKATNKYEHQLYPFDPSLARARSMAGLCALAAGQRDHAARLAQLARDAFLGQPGVSQYFKTPLVDLERRLGS
jgi:eukaryotic-like serine/threonine-protein kinase